LARLLVRLAFFAALVGLAAWLTVEAAAAEEWVWLVPLIALDLYAAVLVGLFGFIEHQLWFTGYRSIRAIFGRHYDEVTFAPLPPQEAADKLDDPAVRKHTA